MVVSDYRMPGLDGVAMIQAMRPLLPHGRFVMLTGVADLDTVTQAINDAGIFRFYTKPCPPERLAVVVLDRRGRLLHANRSGRQADLVRLILSQPTMVT